MTPAPPSWRPLLLEFPPDPDDAAVPPGPPSTDPKETPHAVQDDLPRIDPATPDAARAAPLEPDAAVHPGPVRDRAEGQPRRLDGPLPRGESGQGPPPDGQRRPGDGDPGVAGA